MLEKVQSSIDYDTPFHQKGSLSNEWALWWRFQTNNYKKGYDSSQLQEVFKFQNLNIFSQIYNGSVLGKVSNFINSEKKVLRGASETDKEPLFENLPVDCLMLYRKGIKPEWEDPKNAEGGHWTLEIHSPDLDIADALWQDFGCNQVGEVWNHSERINGGRVLIRSKFSSNTLIKFEFWVDFTKDEMENKGFEDKTEQLNAWHSLRNDICKFSEKLKGFTQESLKWEHHLPKHHSSKNENFTQKSNRNINNEDKHNQK